MRESGDAYRKNRAKKAVALRRVRTIYNRRHMQMSAICSEDNVYRDSL